MCIGQGGEGHLLDENVIIRTASRKLSAKNDAPCPALSSNDAKQHCMISKLTQPVQIQFRHWPWKTSNNIISLEKSIKLFM